MNPRLACARIGILAVCLTLSGCAIGYRNHGLSTQKTVSDVTVEVEGDQDVVGFGTVLDFRAVRFIAPFVNISEEFVLSDDRGGGSTERAQKKTRHLRIDAPVMTFWSLATGAGLEWTPMLEHRTSIDLWLGGESDLRTDDASYWLDVGLGYYQYNLVAIRVFAGWGGRPFRGVSRYLEKSTTVDSYVQGFGGGIEITLAAGEYALDFVKFLMDFDEAQQKIFSGQSPGE